jgi:hypothetical protein
MINLRIYDRRVTILIFLYAILIILGVSFLMHTVLIVPLMNFDGAYVSTREWRPFGKIIIDRNLLFYETMKPRLAQYALTHDWLFKIYPDDVPYVDFLSEDMEVSIQVYVSEVKDAVVYSINSDEPGKPLVTFYVYQASDEAVAKLFRIPHLNYYASKLDNCVCMRVEKRWLPRIAGLPFVYCIRA